MQGDFYFVPDALRRKWLMELGLGVMHGGLGGAVCGGGFLFWAGGIWGEVVEGFGVGGEAGGVGLCTGDEGRGSGAVAGDSAGVESGFPSLARRASDSVSAGPRSKGVPC